MNNPGLSQEEIDVFNRQRGPEPRGRPKTLGGLLRRADAYLIRTHPRAYGCTVFGGLMLASLATIYGAFSMMPSTSSQDAFVQQLKDAPVVHGTWYTGVSLDKTIRQELPSSPKDVGEDPKLNTNRVRTYREQFLADNPDIREILRRRARGEPIPRKVGVKYRELDFQPGFGT